MIVVVVVVVVSWRCEVWSGGGLMEFGGIVKATVSADGHVPLLQSLFFCQPLAGQSSYPQSLPLRPLQGTHPL